MGLFDGQPLTREELIQVETKRRQAEGATIRQLSFSGPGGNPVLRTVRHRPWHEIVGKGPDGMTCGDCEHVIGTRYFKCGRQVSTNGPGTDIRKKDPACRLFKATGGGSNGE